MSFNLLDLYGNMVSIFLLLLIPVTGKVTDFVLDSTAEGEGANHPEKAEIKRYASYAEFFSLLMTSLAFGGANMIYIIWIDEIKSNYLIATAIIIIVFSVGIILLVRSDPHSIQQPITDVQWWDIEEKIPEWAFYRLRRITFSHLYWVLAFSAYIIPSWLIWEQIAT